MSGVEPSESEQVLVMTKESFVLGLHFNYKIKLRMYS